MYLIETKTLRLRYFAGECPPYAILSHTWGPQEVTFAQFQDPEEKRKENLGFQKVSLTCKQARRDGFDYAWVDSCCINKESSAELTEAINSMFVWYSNAAICYAYIEDFTLSRRTPLADSSSLQFCRWFSRGWTLQELLAPSEIVFYGAGWVEFGRKTDMHHILERVTGIPGNILRKEKALEDVSVAARMSWAARRQTTRKEDMAYCLMGLFDVNMPMLYGEGNKAFIRLQEEIIRQTQDDSLFAWCSNQETADEAPYRGLFALSPREFINCADITHFSVNSPDRTTIMGNGQVSLSCIIHTRSDRQVILGLRCFRGQVSKVLGIEAIRVGVNNFLRINPSKLATCPLRSFENIIIERHVSKAKDHLTIDKYQHDGIYLGDLPPGVTLKRVWSEGLSSPPQRKISAINTIGRKTAFELELDTDISGEQKTDGRLLLLFWVRPILGIGLYQYHFDLVRFSDYYIFSQATQPQTISPSRALQVGWADIYVVGSRRRIEGYEMLHFDVGVTISQQRRATRLAERESRIAEIKRHKALIFVMGLVFVTSIVCIVVVVIAVKSGEQN